jgi:hypothetical protein
MAALSAARLNAAKREVRARATDYRPASDDSDPGAASERARLAGLGAVGFMARRKRRQR